MGRLLRQTPVKVTIEVGKPYTTISFQLYDEDVEKYVKNGCIFIEKR